MLHKVSNPSRWYSLYRYGVKWSLQKNYKMLRKLSIVGPEGPLGVPWAPMGPVDPEYARWGGQKFEDLPEKHFGIFGVRNL